MQAKYVNPFTDPAELAGYENSLKVYRDLKNVIDTAGNEGEMRGVLKVAKAMKDAHVAFDIISRTTGLSEKEIEEL